jgi:hypothetical protein
MLHVVMWDLKIFKQKRYALLFCFYNSIHTVQKSVPLLHKVVLHYKIIAAFNTWHSSAVSGVIKHLAGPKVYFSPCKIHIFVTPFSYLTLLTRGIEKWKYGYWGGTAEKMPSLLHECKTLPLQLQLVTTRHLHHPHHPPFGGQNCKPSCMNICPPIGLSVSTLRFRWKTCGKLQGLRSLNHGL